MVEIRVYMEFGMVGVGNGRESVKWMRLCGCEEEVEERDIDLSLLLKNQLKE